MSMKVLVSDTGIQDALKERLSGAKFEAELKWAECKEESEYEHHWIELMAFYEGEAQFIRSILRK